MPDAPRRVYWDACVFLSYVNDDPDHSPVIEAIFDEAVDGEIELLSSMLSVVEVSFGAIEQRGHHLSPDIQARIDGLWLPPSPVKLVEFHRLVADGARALIRDTIARGGSIKPADAIHLSTAQRLQVSEFHTYDQRLLRFGQHAGFPIREPLARRPRLPGT